MVKKCYRLVPRKDIDASIDALDYLYDIDEDYTTKREYIKAAKGYTSEIQSRYGFIITWEDLFGTPTDDGYRYCTICGETFWADDEPHECDRW